MVTVCPSQFASCFLMIRRPVSSTLFPFTTLFRSCLVPGDVLEAAACEAVEGERGDTHGVEHGGPVVDVSGRSEEHTSELQSRLHLVCRLLLEKKTTTRTLLHSPLDSCLSLPKSSL